jgi:mannose-6-phosphate isomerase
MQCHRIILYYCIENIIMENSNKIFKIKGLIKHYDWGGKTFIPQLLNIVNTDNIPFAEYWLGSNLEDRFEKVPYLLKVQDVEKMLSIQVHPSREVAEIKFREENERGIPLDAPDRNYKDKNHKPELLSPLSDFYLLHGFKNPEAMKKILRTVPELNFLGEVFNGSDYKRLYTQVMTMPQEDVNKKLQPLLKRIVPLYEAGMLNLEEENFWAARASLTFRNNGNVDRGIFSIYLFNVVKMTAGQALFQDAGLPHAYLQGYTMEIMANSDNVLRGGLTVKHIDVKELLEHVKYQPTAPDIISGRLSGTNEEIFMTPAEDFQLSRIKIRKHEGIAVPAIKTDIYFVYKGTVDASADDQKERFGPGDAFLAVPGSVVHLGSEEEAVIYRATQPARS